MGKNLDDMCISERRLPSAETRLLALELRKETEAKLRSCAEAEVLLQQNSADSKYNAELVGKSTPTPVHSKAVSCLPVSTKAYLKSRQGQARRLLLRIICGWQTVDFLE